MTAPFAISGADIQPGMTIRITPEDRPFTVSRVQPIPQAHTWLHVYNEQGAAYALQKNAWYADVSDRAGVIPQVEGGEQDEARLGLVHLMNGAPAGEGLSSGSPCRCGIVGGHHADCSVIS